MNTWERQDSNGSSSSDEETFFGPKIPDPVLGKEDDEEDADTMTILAEGTRETFCPESEKQEVDETPEESSWLPDCCNKNTADDNASMFSSPTWFSSTADEKVVEAKATEFANSVDEVSREVNHGASDRAVADFDEATEDSKELTNDDLPVEDESTEEEDSESEDRQASRSPSSERRKRGFAALMASMFPGSNRSSKREEKSRALADFDGEDAIGDEEAPKQGSMKIVGVSDESIDDTISYADKDDNTREGTAGLIPLETHEISDSEDPETGIKTIDRDSATENASDSDDDVKPSRRSGYQRWCCLAVFMVLMTAGVLGIFRPGKIGEIGSSTSRSIEAGSPETPEGEVGVAVDDGIPESETEESEGGGVGTDGDREFPDMEDGPEGEGLGDEPDPVETIQPMPREPATEEPTPEEPEPEAPVPEEPVPEEPEPEEPVPEEPVPEEPEPEEPEPEEPEPEEPVPEEPAPEEQEPEEPEPEEPVPEEPEPEEPEPAEPVPEEPVPEEPVPEEPTPEEPAPEEQEPDITLIPPMDPEVDEESDPEVLPTLGLEYFAAMANAPYDDGAQADLEGQLANVDAEFIVHVGNVRSESPECLYEDYQRAAQSLLSSNTPVFVVPGPNDWSVCDDPDTAYANYDAFFSEFTESNWGVRRRVRRHPTIPSTFRWGYSDDVQILGVDLVASDDDELANKIQETVAWAASVFRGFDGTRVYVFAYSTPDIFVERLEEALPLGVAVTYVNGVDAAAFGPAAFRVSSLPVLVEL